ncbi:MAG TPA: hypothetical protein VGU66_00055 [Candidatus Elarobacter sp.]|nr:hypothetical protein [Candidatus Elarobacter sp.]
MTGGGDTDEFEDEATLDESDDVADETDDIDLNKSDPDPTAGGSDIGGRAAEPDDLGALGADVLGEDQQADGDGQAGAGTGPTDR